MTSVNRPTDVKQKEADVNRKLQLYGIIAAFQNGKAPSNDQIDVALNSFLASKALSSPSDQLSSEGKTLVADFRDVVKRAQTLLLSKNEGNLIQDFIWQTQQFDPQGIAVPGAPLDKDTAKQHGDQVLQGFRTLGLLLIRNGEFRKLLKDASILARDMAGDAAANTAAKIRPSQEQLSQMDHPAESNLWHEAPDLSKDALRNKAKNVYKGSPTEDATKAANEGLDAAQGNDSTIANGQRGAAVAANTLQQKVSENTDQETKDQAKARTEEHKRRAKDYFNKKMPQERKDQIIWRLKKMVLECQQHPDYIQAINTLLTLAEEYGGHGRSLTQGGTNTVKETRKGLAAAEDDLKTLIERFANGTSTDGLWDAIGTVYDDANKDEELKGWFKSMDAFIRRCLLEQGFILDDASDAEWNQLYDNGHRLLREKYRSHTDRISDEIKFLADQFDQDPQNKAFGQSVQTLVQHLGQDQQGKATFKPHLVKDLTDVIIPSVIEGISYVPLPRVEYSDSQVDAVVENVVLESDNLMPNVFEINSQHHFRWGRKNKKSNQRQAFEVHVAGMQVDLRDVAYHIKRKRGFPSITDTGLVNILLPGDGFSFKLRLTTADPSDESHFFKIDHVDADLKGLQLDFIKSRHKLLLSLFKPFAIRAAKPMIRRGLESAIKQEASNLDSLLHAIKMEADRAAKDAAADPANAPGAWSRYASASQAKISERRADAKKRVRDATEDKKFNMAMTMKDSMFPDVALDRGISSRASELKDQAAEGDRWQSPLFSLGSAERSRDIPKAPQVVRKTGGTSSLNGGTGPLNGTTGSYNNTTGSYNNTTGSYNNTTGSYNNTTGSYTGKTSTVPGVST